MKIKFTNSFHNTEAVISVMDIFANGDDTMIELQAEVYCEARHAMYAKRKLQQIRRAMCPNHRTRLKPTERCTCDGFTKQEVV